MKIRHELEPFINKNSEILILGSIPSVKSRQLGFYYSHPQNKFWKVLSKVYSVEEPKTIEDKKRFLNTHKIALYDVIEECEINGSSDNSIKNIKVNDIKKLIKNTNITKIFTTGKKANQLYNKYCYNDVLIEGIYLPSTSPANAGYCSFDELVKIYKNNILSKK